MNDWLTVWSDAMQRTLLPMTIAVVVLWCIESLTTWLTPKHRSWLWRLTFIKCLFVFCLPIALPLPSIVGNSLHLVSFPTVIQAAPLEAVTPSPDRLTSNTGIETSPQFSSVAQIASSQESTTETPAFFPVANTTLWLFLLWATGLVLQLVLLLHHHAALRTQLRRGKAGNIPKSLRTMYRETADRMGVRHPPVLQLNDRFTSPALVFSGRVLLVLPADFQQRHGDEACRAAIAHELAHHRRSDLHWNALVTLVCAVLFFFPPLWLARRRYRVAVESACDWDAIGYARVDLATYARLLIELLEPPPRTSPSPAILSMAGSEPFRSLSERLKTMKRFNGPSRRTRVIHTVVSLLMLCVLTPWTHADDKYKADNKYKKDTQTSSATVTSSSSSQSSGDGDTRSTSTVTGTANGNAAGSGAANGKTTSLKMRNGKEVKSNEASSSGAAKVAGQNKPDRRYDKINKSTTTSNQASSTSSIQVNDIKISRSVHSEGGVTSTKMDVIDKNQKIAVRESSDEGIEVRVRDRDKNADGSVNEKVYTAKSWDELQQQAPDLVRKIKRYEKIAGNVTAATDVRGGVATASSIADAFSHDVDVVQLDAKEMMKAQLRDMLEQHPDNPEMQKMIRKTLDSLDKN
ncbi:M56 family metallopeptidase [Novipirellula rosea]|uniref:Peptidase M56 domain-containing protein n=1 Tax=Novipirellula rosea TaxID=1031540 RepID=A0ABP8NQ51_9BACT